MIDTKHTPGPWDAGAFPNYDKYIRIDQPGIRIDNDDVDPDEAEANARLVTAAPDMLETLLEFVSTFSTVPGSIGDEVRQKARAAIAKACGVPIEDLGPR